MRTVTSSHRGALADNFPRHLLGRMHSTFVVLVPQGWGIWGDEEESNALPLDKPLEGAGQSSHRHKLSLSLCTPYGNRTRFLSLKGWSPCQKWNGVQSVLLEDRFTKLCAFIALILLKTTRRDPSGPKLF